MPKNRFSANIPTRRGYGIGNNSLHTRASQRQSSKRHRKRGAGDRHENHGGENSWRDDPSIQENRQNDQFCQTLGLQEGSEAETERPSFANEPRRYGGSPYDADRSDSDGYAEKLEQSGGTQVDKGPHTRQREKEGHQQREGHDLQAIKDRLVQIGGHDCAD